MPNRKSDLIPVIHLIGDLVLLNVAFCIPDFFPDGHGKQLMHDQNLVMILCLNLFWIASTFLLKTYKICRVMRMGTILNMFIKSCVLHIFIIFSFIVITKGTFASIKLFAFNYSLFILFIFTWRIIAIQYLKNYRARGYNFRTIIIAGAGQIGKDMFDFFQSNPEHGYRCLGFFDDKEEVENRLGAFDELENFATANKVDEIYCAMPGVDRDRVNELMAFADNHLIRLKIIPDFRRISNQKFEITFYNNIPVINFRRDPLEDIANRAFKRGFDLVFSSIVILCIFPWLFPIIALCIKFSSKGPIFFKQMRSGRNNKPFVCYKFRTMKCNELADVLQATQNDSRITSVGKFLRKTSLDELPQFICVLFGNMSVVGPRPHMLSHTEKYSKEVDKFMSRHFVKAGITGLAQIKGCRGETSDSNQMDNRVQHDLHYIENWTFYFDVKIIIHTVLQMLRGKLKGA
jgi:Undecaprenyl-phosphate glucose phosphotransferase